MTNTTPEDTAVQLPDEHNYIEVLKEITKNCDMDTQTACEKLLRQILATQAHTLETKHRAEVENVVKWIKKMSPDNAMELDVALRKPRTTKAQVADAAMKYAYNHVVSFLEATTTTSERNK